MKNLFTILFTTFWLAACNNPQSAHLTATANEKVVRQYFDHFNRHEWKKMAETYSEVAEFKDPSLEPGIVKQTRQQIIEKYAALGKMFPDVKDEIVQLYASGDKHIIVEFISRGTAPDGSKFELPICTVFTLEKSLITKDFTYYDNFEEPKK
jgi:ketosteroid isomerase-like protein